MGRCKNLTGRRYLTLGLVCLFLIIVLNGNPNALTAEDKVLKVATEPTFPPFEMLAPEGGALGEQREKVR